MVTNHKKRRKHRTGLRFKLINFSMLVLSLNVDKLLAPDKLLAAGHILSSVKLRQCMSKLFEKLLKTVRITWEAIMNTNCTILHSVQVYKSRIQSLWIYIVADCN